MRFARRRAVSPIIASLLLIAIAVAAGIIVYVYVNSLAGGLTSGGGGQVSQQIQMQSYTFNTVKSGQVIDVFLENTGGSSLSISSVYVDGTPLGEWGTTTAGTYTKYLVAPTSAVGCFALVPQTVTNSPVTLTPDTTQTTGTTGAPATCVGNTPTSCAAGAPEFCIDTPTAETETGGATGTAPLASQGTAQLIIAAAGASCTGTSFPLCPATTGTSHTIKIVTATGGTAVFTVVAGRTG